MPIVVANLKASTFQAIQRLVDAGRYSDPAEFLELAALNQLELEGREQRTGPASAPEQRIAHASPVSTRRAPDAGRRSLVGPTRSRPDPVSDAEFDDILARLRVERLHNSRFKLSLKARVADASEGRIWGQINRILPLKVALRWLAVYQASHDDSPSIDSLFSQMASDVATIGSALDAVDTSFDRVRDERLATGLPRRDNALSTDRFLSQYLARTTRKGTIHPGAAIQYGLSVIDGARFALTETGFEFASLRNPILDDDLAQADSALTAEECDYFVRQAIPYLPSELYDFSRILTFVMRGDATPNDQIRLMAEHLPTEWSDTMLRTHVAGVIARMVDLGLLSRKWQGRHVEYEATELAGDFAAAHSLI